MKNQNVVIAVCLGLFVSMSLNAQLKIGGFINFNVAGISVKPDVSSEDYSSYLGLGIGGIASYAIRGGLEVQTEPMILQKGGRITEFGETLKLKITYLEIPVFIRYVFPVNDKIFPYAILGPNLGLRTSAKVVFPDGSSSKSNDEFSVLDLGAGLGAGCEYVWNFLVFFGEIKYVHGLNNINKESGESKVRNRGPQILLGAKFPIEIK